MTESDLQDKGTSVNPVLQFCRRSLMGGLLVLLPVAIVTLFFKWLYEAASGFIAPFTKIFVQTFGFPQFVADVIVIALIVLLCFAMGNVVATRVGAWAWDRVESSLMQRVPGYRSVREVTVQLLGKSNDSPFKRGEVAQVWLYGRDVSVSVLGLVTSRHESGVLTVFVPTGPNPTSGFIYHVAAGLVELRPELRVEQMMKTVISCGAGSAALLSGAVASAAVQQDETISS
jgi:uncharacterized membrane protein